MSKEERKTLWDVPGVGQLIAGLKTELMRCNTADTVVHVQFPPGTPHDRSEQFARALRREFPAKVRMAFTTPGVKLAIHRPRTVNLTLTNMELSHNDVVEHISKILEEKADQVHITLNNVTLKDD